MTNRKLSPLLIVSVLLITIIVYCLLHPGIISLLTVLAALALASFLMLLHLVLAWSRLALTYRLSVLLCVVAWLAMFSGLMHAI